MYRRVTPDNIDDNRVVIAASAQQCNVRVVGRIRVRVIQGMCGGDGLRTTANTTRAAGPSFGEETKQRRKKKRKQI